jgi:hypothetical protein
LGDNQASPLRPEVPFPTLVRVADNVTKATAIIGLAALPFCLYSYGLRPGQYLLNPVAPVLYYLAATISVLLFASLRLGVLYRISQAIFLLLLVGAVYTAELLLTVSDETFDPRRTAAVREGIHFDTRDKLDVITDMETRNPNVVPNVNPSNFLTVAADGSRRSQITLHGVETLPLGGVSNALTVYCNESGQYVVYTSDEHGFNNPVGIWKGIPLAVAAVGDSFTQGSCVAPDKNVLALIRRRYPLTLNLGMVNDGPLTEFATLQEYLPALQPRVLLWFYYEGNDLEDLLSENETPLLRSYLGTSFSQSLLREQRAIDDAIAAYLTDARDRRGEPIGGERRLLETLTPFVKLEHFRQRVALSAPGSHKEHPDVGRNLALLQKILVAAKALVGSWGGTVYVVYLPEWLRYAHPAAASKYRDAVLSTVQSAGIPLVDIHLAFEAHGDPLALFPYRQNGHYNEDGYRVVAEAVLSAIAPYLERNSSRLADHRRW